MRKGQLPESLGLGRQPAYDLALESALRLLRVADAGVDLGAVIHGAALRRSMHLAGRRAFNNQPWALCSPVCRYPVEGIQFHPS